MSRAITGIAMGLAFSTSGVFAQTYLEIEICNTAGNTWEAYAQIVNPEGEVLAAIADLGFNLMGEGFSNFEYNSAFDSDFFGDATVSVTPSSVDFLGGNTLPPLNNAGGPDSSNPLYLFTFEADLVHSFTFVGQVTGAYTGTPFPEILVFQDALGNPGNTPYTIDNCFPSPGAASLLAMAGIGLGRRRTR